MIHTLERFLEWGGVKKAVTCLVFSGIALLVSIFDLLPQLPFDAAYSCGSNRLAAHMKQLHAQHGFPAYVSLEEHMACGVGACKGCICTAHDKDSGEASYVRVCKSGPVFDVDRVLQWNAHRIAAHR